MHIKKNVTKMIWRILYGRTDKDKIGKNCSDIAEANHALGDSMKVGNTFWPNLAMKT